MSKSREILAALAITLLLTAACVPGELGGTQNDASAARTTEAPILSPEEARLYACLLDGDRDGTVDSDDDAMFRRQFGQLCSDLDAQGEGPCLDPTGDGLVDLSDLVLLASVTNDPPFDTAEEMVAFCSDGVWPAQSSDDLLLWLPLDSDTADASNHAATVTCSGSSCPTPATGAVDGGYDFDGNDHLEIDGFDVAGSGLTIAAWIKPASLTGCGPRVVSKASGHSDAEHVYMLGLCNGNLRFRLKTSSTSTLIDGPVMQGEWSHVAATYDGQTMRVLLNGVQVGSQPKGGAVARDASLPLWIGANPPDGYGAFDGVIDDVRIYDYALSQTELADLLNVSCTDEDGDGYSIEGGICGDVDCQDSDSAISPAATDVPENGVDEDCNGSDAQFAACPHGAVPGPGCRCNGVVEQDGFCCADTWQVGECIEILPECNNDILEDGEQCDGANLAGETCLSLGYESGNLACTNDCRFDYADCIARATNGNFIPISPEPSGVQLIGENHPNLFYNQAEIDELRRLISSNEEPELTRIYNERCRGRMAEMPPHPWYATRGSGPAGSFYVGVPNMKAAISYMVEPTAAKAQRIKEVLYAYMYFHNDYYPTPYYQMRPGLLSNPQMYGHVGWPLAWLFNLTYHAGVYSDEEKAEIKEYFTKVADFRWSYLSGTSWPDAGYGLITEDGIERRGYLNWAGFERGMRVVAALNGNDQGLLDFVTKSGCDTLYTDPRLITDANAPDRSVCNIRDLYQLVNGMMFPSGATVDWYVRDRGAVDEFGNVTADYPRVYHAASLKGLEFALQGVAHNGWEDVWNQDAQSMKRAIVWQILNHPVKYFNGQEVAAGAWPHGSSAFNMRRFYYEAPEIRDYVRGPKNYMIDTTRPLVGNVGRVLMFPLGPAQ